MNKRTMKSCFVKLTEGQYFYTHYIVVEHDAVEVETGPGRPQRTCV